VGRDLQVPGVPALYALPGLTAILCTADALTGGGIDVPRGRVDGDPLDVVEDGAQRRGQVGPGGPAVLRLEDAGPSDGIRIEEALPRSGIHHRGIGGVVRQGSNRQVLPEIVDGGPAGVDRDVLRNPQAAGNAGREDASSLRIIR